MVQYSCGLEEADAKAGAEAAGGFSSSSSSLSSGSSSSPGLKGPSGGSKTAGQPSGSAEKVIRCWPVVKLFRRYVGWFFFFSRFFLLSLLCVYVG